MKLKYAFIVMMIFSILEVKSQNSLRLKVGDIVPDLKFVNIINYPNGQAKLSDFKGKLVILDFWNIGCIPCISAFPKMEKLQKEFGDKIQIFLVNTSNSLKSLEDEYGKFPDNSPSPIISTTKLPFIFDVTENENSILGKLFEHSGEPFHVWIDQNGIVKATTPGAYNTTANQIKNFLDGKEIDFIEQHTAEDVFDYVEGNNTMLPGSRKSLIRAENAWILNKLQYSSIFTSGLFAKGLGAGNIIDSATKRIIGFRRELPDLKLIMWAHLSNASFPENLIIINGENGKNLVEPRNENELSTYRQNTTHFYELRLPVSRLTNDQKENEKLFKYILKQDIECFLGIRAHIEKRKINCLILVRTSNKDLLRSKGGEELYESKKNELLIMKNLPFQGLVNGLREANRYYQDPYVIDETGYPDTFKVDMTIRASLNNITSLNKELAKYSLLLKNEKREMSVLVLEDAFK